MSADVDLSAIVDCLQSDALLCRLIDAAPPQAIVMPFAREHERSYLFVAVFFDNEKLRKEDVFTACKRIVTLLRPKYLSALGGVEILVSVIGSGRTERVVRLSIPKESLDAFERVEGLEPNAGLPASGMTTLMYKQMV